MIQIIVSIISGVLTLAGVCITAWLGNRRTADAVTSKLHVAQAVTEQRLGELTREVREHNHFARRMPVVEEQIKLVVHRIEDLERREGRL